MKNKLVACFIFLGVLLAPIADAHRIEVPVTSIDWNPRSDKWEITHRMSAHDLETALGSNIDISTLSDAELSKLVCDYVEAHFQIIGIMFLNRIGAEIEGDAIWVYYELWGWDQTVIVRNHLLAGADATAAALININNGASKRSVIFDVDAGWKGVPLHRAPG